MLHLRCGDDIIARLRSARLPGTVARWADPLCEGPLGPWPDDQARRAARAAWLSERYGRDRDAVLRELEADDAALDSAGAHDHVVLWFEHDLYDQVILVFLLSRLAGLGPGRTMLICLDSHPEVPGFSGLGNLTTEQLAALFPHRVTVVAETFERARSVWQALSHGDVLALRALADGPPAGLPFAGQALMRYLADLPDLRTGLTRTESMALRAVAAGCERPPHLFRTVQRFEVAPWQGDSMFYAVLVGLASGPVPLLAGMSRELPPVGDAAFGNLSLTLTGQGQAVLVGRDDWEALSGQPRGLGGRPLAPGEPRWRWDDGHQRPVRVD